MENDLELEKSVPKKTMAASAAFFPEKNISLS
jgi:hypothetical protein